MGFSAPCQERYGLSEDSAFDGHHAILAAFERRNAPAGRARMTEHISRYKERALAVLESEPVF